MDASVEFDERPAPLAAIVVGLPLSAVGLGLLIFGIYHGAEPWIMLGLFCSGLGVGCLYQRGCALAGFGLFPLLAASFLIYSQILPQYRTHDYLKGIDQKAQVALNGRQLEPDMAARVLQALSESRWNPGIEAKRRGDSWKRAPWLTVSSGVEQVEIEVGIMGKTPVLRRERGEGMNCGIITCQGLWEPLAELGWETLKGEYVPREWSRPPLRLPSTAPTPHGP